MKHDRMKSFWAALLLWICFAFSATAAEAEKENGDQDKAKVGTRTAQWLDIQREGRAAGNMLPVPAVEAGPSHQRYIDSFATPIPDQLLSPAPASGAKK